jgi:Zn-dependent M28 family amino/carboxypeptidase
MKKLILFGLLTGSILISCNFREQNREKAAEKNEKAQAVKIPEFNPDSAYRYVKEQLDFGPRVPNTPAHGKCAEYLIAKLKSFQPDVVVQSGQVKAFNGTVLNFQNIIASFNPGLNDRIFISAHWDSRPFADHDPDPAKRKKPVPAANDGASGVGILLEIARQLSIQKPSIGVDLILFDVEDYGPPEDQKTMEDTGDWWGLGSQYWSRKPHTDNYFAKYGILLDMVGAPNATFLMESFSMQYAPDVVDHVWKTGNRIGYSAYFPFTKGNYINDDHYYVNKILNIPTIDIIHLDPQSNTGFYKTWHTTSDDLESIDKYTLKAVGQTLLTVIYEEN